jgi:flagellar motility protein MotE (MotC chaperone)
MANNYDQFFKNARKASSQAGERMLHSNHSQAELLQEIEKEIKLNSQKLITKKNKNLVPLKLIFSTVVGTIVTVVALKYIDQIEGYLTKIEISILGESAKAESKPAGEDKKEGDKKAEGKEEAAKGENKEASAEKGKEGEHKDGSKEESKDAAKDMAKEGGAESSGKQWTKEDIDHFAKLNDRKKEIDLREEELNRLEAELQNQKKELEAKMKKLEETRGQISTTLEDRVKVDEQKVDTLVQMYSNMKPSNAAKIIETIDEDLAVEVLGKMKKKNAAEIMNLLKPEKAQVLSEKYAGYKKR